ncbi:hypothetical protein SNE25_01435 [Mucilaginibacter sabulilitoris]|uniref:Uncharacterized protein n=1 Tax=Mucilaginibacter sabulilitoris TaxID=1173583 RepID=A0ABZ0TN11_9SPHI|nr:hypothetical protein [Mucilaginibacter sabulilitoris]WPU94186.1 hypothetical protein SNE25_01435 [Mucilaginibacter sabulilitoris]
MTIGKGLLFSLLISLVVQGCHSVVFKQSFDKQKWNDKEDWDYPQRNNVVDDLVKNHRLKGLNYKQLINLLGIPQGQSEDSAGIYYQIVMDFGNDIDPVYTKNLLIGFNKDSIVNSITINEWKKP